MSGERITLARRIADLTDEHGGLRAAARVLEIDPAYLCRLASRQKRAPSAALLRRMGLRAVVTYERTK